MMGTQKVGATLIGQINNCVKSIKSLSKNSETIVFCKMFTCKN